MGPWAIVGNFDMCSNLVLGQPVDQRQVLFGVETRIEMECHIVKMVGEDFLAHS